MKFLPLLILVSSLGMAQDAGNVITFQGQLANQSGQPISPPSPGTLVFRLYRQAVGGVALWEESQPNISVSAGRFSVLLGSRTELPAAPNFNTTLYLGITVDDGNPATADVEMRPRQAIVPVISASYARNADKLNGHDWSAILEGGSNDPTTTTIAEGKLPPGIAIPIGGVIMWWGSINNVPAGFEICNGGLPTSPGATMQGRKPDLRDRFVKGAPVEKADVKSDPTIGGQHFLDLSHAHATVAHQHTVPHDHGSSGLWVPIAAGHAGAIWWREHGFDRGDIGAPGYDSVKARERGSANEVSFGTAVLGRVDGATPLTSLEAPNTLTALPSPIDNRPAFLEMIFIIRVK